jgi:hypothetical protein
LIMAGRLDEAVEDVGALPEAQGAGGQAPP